MSDGRQQPAGRPASSSPATAAWWARPSCGGSSAAGCARPAAAHAAPSSTCTSQAAVEAFFAAERPDVRVPRRGQGRRHPRQQHLPGRLHPRQPADPDQRHPRGLRARRAASCCSSAQPASTRGSRRSRCREDALLTGPLEPTNESYAIAKIAGHQAVPGLPPPARLRLPSALMPTNLYGPGDNFDLENSPRAAGADPQASTRPRLRGDAEVVDLGHRHAAPRVPARGRPRRRLSCS